MRFEQIDKAHSRESNGSRMRMRRLPVPLRNDRLPVPFAWVSNHKVSGFTGSIDYRFEKRVFPWFQTVVHEVLLHPGKVRRLGLDAHKLETHTRMLLTRGAHRRDEPAAKACTQFEHRERFSRFEHCLEHGDPLKGLFINRRRFGTCTLLDPERDIRLLPEEVNVIARTIRFGASMKFSEHWVL